MSTFGWFAFGGTVGTAFGFLLACLCRATALQTAHEEVARLENTVVALMGALDFKDAQLSRLRRDLAVAVGHPCLGGRPVRDEGSRFPTDWRIGGGK